MTAANFAYFHDLGLSSGVAYLLLEQFLRQKGALQKYRQKYS